jgi:hypothetical protein
MNYPSHSILIKIDVSPLDVAIYGLGYIQIGGKIPHKLLNKSL